MLLFVAGAALREGLNKKLGAKHSILQWKMLLGSSKSNVTCGFFIFGLWSDYFSDRFYIGNDVSAVFCKFLPDVGWPFCVPCAIFGEFGG